MILPVRGMSARTIGGEMMLVADVYSAKPEATAQSGIRLSASAAKGSSASAAAVAEQGGVGDHGGVVAGVDEGDEAEVDAVALGPGGELPPQQAVGGGAAGDGEQRRRGAARGGASRRSSTWPTADCAEAGQEVEHGLGGSSSAAPRSIAPSVRSRRSISSRAWLFNPE